jgi:hypothetical protein
MDTKRIALIAAAVGTGLGAGLTWLVRRDQWQPEQAVSSDADRRSVYARFLLAADAYEQVVFDLQQDAGAMRDPEGVPRSALAEQYRDLQAAMTDITLVGSIEVCVSAVQLAGALVPAFTTLVGDHYHGPYGWSVVKFVPLSLEAQKALHDEEEDSVQQTRFDFLIAVRKELGLRGESGRAFASLPSHIR